MSRDIANVEVSESVVRSYDDLPASMDANDLARALCISKTQAYYLLKSEGFPKVMVGEARMIVPKSCFLEWLSKQVTGYSIDFGISHLRKDLKEQLIQQITHQQVLINQILQQQQSLQSILNNL